MKSMILFWLIRDFSLQARKKDTEHRTESKARVLCNNCHSICMMRLITYHPKTGVLVA